MTTAFNIYSRFLEDSEHAYGHISALEHLAYDVDGNIKDAEAALYFSLISTDPEKMSGYRILSPTPRFIPPMQLLQQAIGAAILPNANINMALFFRTITSISPLNPMLKSFVATNPLNDFSIFNLPNGQTIEWNATRYYLMACDYYDRTPQKEGQVNPQIRLQLTLKNLMTVRLYSAGAPFEECVAGLELNSKLLKRIKENFMFIGKGIGPLNKKEDPYIPEESSSSSKTFSA